VVYAVGGDCDWGGFVGVAVGADWDFGVAAMGAVEGGGRGWVGEIKKGGGGGLVSWLVGWRSGEKCGLLDWMEFWDGWEG